MNASSSATSTTLESTVLNKNNLNSSQWKEETTSSDSDRINLLVTQEDLPAPSSSEILSSSQLEPEEKNLLSPKSALATTVLPAVVVRTKRSRGEIKAADDDIDDRPLSIIADSTEDEYEVDFPILLRSTTNALEAVKSGLITLDIQIRKHQSNPVVCNMLRARRETLVMTARYALQFIGRRASSICIDG